MTVFQSNARSSGGVLPASVVAARVRQFGDVRRARFQAQQAETARLARVALLAERAADAAEWAAHIAWNRSTERLEAQLAAALDAGERRWIALHIATRAAQ